MIKLLELARRKADDLRRRIAALKGKPEAGSPAAESSETQVAGVPKPPPDLPLFFMLSHLEEDGPVRMDGVKLGVCEVTGLEIDEPKLGAFAGALNACEFPFQLLIRQHPPRLDGLRANLEEAQPQDLPPQTRAASESLHRLLTDLETRDGILDRRFYAVCEFARIDELRGLLARGGLSVHHAERAASFECSSCRPRSAARPPSSTRTNRSRWRSTGATCASAGASCARCIWANGPGRWHPGFLQGLMAAGAPMDLSIHLGPIPAEQAARTLEWQKVRFESAQSLSLKAGPHHVARGRDRPGGHHAASRRGAAGTRAALPLFAVGDPAREGRGLPQGDDPTGEGPLRRHPGQARQHGVQAEGGTSLHFASRPQRRRRVAKPRHVQHCAALPLLAAGPGHQERDSLRHRHAGLLPCGLRPLGRHPPQREHGRPRTVGQRQVFRYQARRVAGPVPGRDRLRHRPGGRVRGHGDAPRPVAGCCPPASPARA